jgi:uncharacterized protein YraI
MTAAHVDRLFSRFIMPVTVWIRVGLLAACLTLSIQARAQETTPTETPTPAVNAAGSLILPGSVPTNSWVTTQDYVALRLGPSRNFEQLTTVPAALTLPAYGRTSDTRWVQVEYQGQRGWIAARYLVWSGDVINLPIDGVNPAPYIRRAATVAITTRETAAYAFWDDPVDQHTVLPAGAGVELTGRIGDDEGNYYQNFFRIQVRYNDQLYWVASYDLRLVDGDYRRLLDLAYLFPYGRLFLGFQGNMALAIGSFRQIDDVWTRLSAGNSVACDPIPPLVDREITTADAAREPTFVPAVTALESAIDQINGAITAFRDACTNSAFTLTPEYITAQVSALDDAYRNLVLSASLLEPLRVRNPLLHEGGAS